MLCYFQDIHYVAQDKGETALAEVARRKAEQIDAESLATGNWSLVKVEIINRKNTSWNEYSMFRL